MGLVSDIYVPGQVEEKEGEETEGEGREGDDEPGVADEQAVEDKAASEEQADGSKSPMLIGVVLSALGAVTVIGVVFVRRRKWANTMGGQAAPKRRQERIPLLTASFTTSSNRVVATATPAHQL
jgi:hypothetical protein